jgi:hypothetical protein
MGHTVHRLANGVSVKALEAAGQQFETATGPEEVLSRRGIPDVLLTSMCSDGGIGRDLVPLVRSGTVVVAVQDQWGGRLNTDWRDAVYRPNYVVVNDPVGVRLVREAWPDFPAERIHALGYAALDSLAHFSREFARSEVRGPFGLGIVDAVPLIYVSGQLHGSGAMLEALAGALPKEFSGHVWLGKHPRMDESNPALAEEWGRWNTAATRLPVLHRNFACSELLRIAAADVVVSMFSTALMHAAALRVPAISIVFPGSVMQQAYVRETGGLLSVHPLVELGCVAGSTSVPMLREHLSDALRGALIKQLTPAQDAFLRVDGMTGQRIAQFIHDLF